MKKKFTGNRFFYSFFYKSIALIGVLSVIFLAGCSLPKPNPNIIGNRGERVEQLQKGVVDSARSRIGVRYKLGGVSSKTGFDCSGLVFWSYLQNGIHLPRTTREQINAGKKVQRKELKPGDLVFFKIIRRRRATLHIGIYAGNKKFIHSPRTGKTVEESSLASAYWAKHYLTARRIINHEKK